MSDSSPIINPCSSFPSKSDAPSLIEVCWISDSEHPFISAVYGSICIKAMEEIEQQIADDIDEILDQGDGYYLFRAQRYEAQRGEYGRVELESYWGLYLQRYQSFDNGTDSH